MDSGDVVGPKGAADHIALRIVSNVIVVALAYRVMTAI